MPDPFLALCFSSYLWMLWNYSTSMAHDGHSGAGREPSCRTGGTDCFFLHGRAARAASGRVNECRELGDLTARRSPSAMTWKRRGGRKVIIAPDGGDPRAPAKPRPDETLIRALARAHRWKRLLEEGGFRSAGEIAEEGVTRSFVNRLLRLTLLSPDIVETI